MKRLVSPLFFISAAITLGLLSLSHRYTLTSLTVEKLAIVIKLDNWTGNATILRIGDPMSRDGNPYAVEWFNIKPARSEKLEVENKAK